MSFLRVLELFSGIGGMHYALNESGVRGHVVTAVDINSTANNVYRTNFPNTTLLYRNVQALTSKHIDDMAIDVILMSPPCQPFTRLGLKKDMEDARTSPFLHVIDLLPQLHHRFRYLLVENVMGFETSQVHRQLISALDGAGFIFQEFLLSPYQFSIPNARRRYYLIAKRRPLSFCFVNGCLMEKFPWDVNEEYSSEESVVKKLKGLNEKYRSLKAADGGSVLPCYCLEHILGAKEDMQELSLADKTLAKHSHLLDVVTPKCCKSCCFTKAYGHYVEGTGSVLCTRNLDRIAEVFAKCKDLEAGSREQLELLTSLGLRYFSPQEIARLMCFPDGEFVFPEGLTTKQKYRLLGNSINVHVVSLLIVLLAYGD